MSEEALARARAVAAKLSARVGGGSSGGSGGSGSFFGHGPITIGGYVNTNESYRPPVPVATGANDTLLGKRVRPGDDADGEDDEPSSKEHRSDQQLSVRQEERALALSTMQSPLSREPEKANPHTFSLSSALYANDQGFTMTGSRVPFERTREGGGAGGQLGGRNGDCSKDMEVPQEQVGLIIGKQGATVREIQDCTGVHVNVSRDPPPDGRPVRLVTLRGTSQQVAAGEIEVRRVCAGGRVGVEGSEGSVGPSGGGGGGGGGFSGPRPGLGFSGGAGGREEVMLIPQQTISLVIGRGGETIRGIEMRSGAMVKVQREEADAAGMRMIKLIGTPEQCGAARGEIDHIVSSSREMGGQGVGRYGGPPGGGPGGYGPPQPGVPGVDGFAPPGGAGGGRPGMTTLTIPVHAASTGIIIGRGGEIVRRLEQLTGARIRVSRDHPEMHDVIVQGRPDQCEHARTEIDTLIRQREGGGGPVDVRQLGGPGGPPQGYGPPGGYGRGPPPGAYGGGGGYGGPHDYRGPPPQHYGGPGPYGGPPPHGGPPPPHHGGHYGGPPPAAAAAASAAAAAAPPPPPPGAEDEAPVPPSDPAEFASWWPTLSMAQQMAYYKKYNPELLATLPQ